MITFITTEASNNHSVETYIMESGSKIYRKMDIKGVLTAWKDDRYAKIIYQLFLNKEEFDKVKVGFGGVSWTFGIHFYGDNYIYIYDKEQFDRALQYLQLSSL